jgi:cob(I)alamin adenosyltransferase
VKIYTKTGDDGKTGLLGARRVSKDDLRIEAYGSIDELNAVLGVVRATDRDGSADVVLAQIQDELFAVGAALADPSPDGPFHASITPDYTTRLEHTIDVLEGELPPLNQFILPGGSPASAHLHLARTVCRRAERVVIRLGRQPDEHVPDTIRIYLNRLSDFLFVLARVVNHRAGVSDVPWSGRR